MQTRRGKCLIQSGPIRILAGLHLGEFSDDRPIAAIEVRFDRGALRIEAEAAPALATRGNAVTRNEFAVVRCHGVLVTKLGL